MNVDAVKQCFCSDFYSLAFKIDNMFVFNKMATCPYDEMTSLVYENSPASTL